MIPTDVVSRLQVSSDLATRPVAPTQEITDKLPDLAVGQRVLAEIQALLPNGTYRALINQRNVTLALPFSAKSGDTLELQVTDTDGKLTLAVVSPKDSETTAKPGSTVSATLSRTGQLISDLLAPNRQTAGQTDKGLTLNGNQPLVEIPPKSAADILPNLKQAILQSGMFYESHQAEWVAGRFPGSALLNEPQGKLSAPVTPATIAGERPVPSESDTPSAPGSSRSDGQVAPHAAVVARARTQLADSATTTGRAIENDTGPSTTATTRGEIIAPQTQGIVQQQLDALATQVFIWQGQAWPGQAMHWEIDEKAGRDGNTAEDSADQWSTRLRMVLPKLGEVDVRISLNGNQISLSIGTDQESSRELLASSSNELRSQLDEAGLALAVIGIDILPPPSEDSGGS